MASRSTDHDLTAGTPDEPGLLSALLPAGARRLLHLGCGDGTVGRRLAEARAGLEVVGIDTDAALVAAAARVLTRALGADLVPAQGLPLPAGERFDVVLVTAAAARHRDLRTLLTLGLPHLSPGGCFLVPVANPRSQDRILELLGLGGAGAHDLTGPLAGAEAEALLAQLGLEVTVRREVRLPLRDEFEAVAAAAVHLGADASQLRDQAAVAWILLRAETPPAAPPPADPAYERVRAAMSAAVESARRAGVEVGDAPPPGRQALDPSAPRPRVSIVIPVYNQAEFTEKCLYAIAANSGGPDEPAPEYEVIVVDNGSTDWTMYLLHAMEGDIRVISNDANLGFARACNQGAAEARGDFVLFLNNDTVPHPGWLQPLVALADSDPGIGALGAKLLYPDTGRIQHAGLAMVGGVPEHLYRGLEADDPRVDAVRDLDMVTGACLMVRSDLLTGLGGFDTRYLNGVEDVDLCLRVRDAGYRVVYCPGSVLDHHEGVSEGRFDHVRDNVRQFLEQWGERFDEEGRFRPTQDPAAGPAAPGAAAIAAAGEGQATASGRAAQSFRGNWEGSFFLHSSLAYVNRELVLALLATGRCELGLVPYEADQFGVEADPERFGALAQRLGQPLSEGVDFHLRHRWPPDFSLPPNGRFVLMQPWEFGRLPRAWVDPIQQNVDQVWAYTRYVRNCYVDSGIDPERVAVVPLGVDPARFRPGLPPLELATEKGFRFLFVGGTLYRKGIDLLLEAYRLAFGPEDDVCLVIKDMGVHTFYRNQTAGDRIRRLQADPECGEILYLTEDLPGEAMPRLYASAHSLVHPYRGEGFGLPVAEAMACGLPVVVTEGGACDDFCPAELAYRVPAKRRAIRFQEETAGQAWQLEPEVGALADRLREVFERRSEAAERGARASAHIHHHFSWARAAERALEALGRLESAPNHAAAAARAAAPALADIRPEPAGAAVVVLEAGVPADLSGLEAALGPFDLYDVAPGPDHALGEQLEAIRANAAAREYLVVLRSDVDASESDVRAFLSHLRSDPRLGLIAPSAAERQAGGSTVDIECPELACVVFRLEAMARAGGFDGAFRTTAALANAARCLRRAGYRTAAAADVTFTDPEPRARILRLAGSGDAPAAEGPEGEAVRELERGDRHRESGETVQAEAAYRRALGAKPDFVEVIVVLADLLLGSGRAGEAAGVIEQLPALDPDSSFAHNYAGMVCHRAGRLGEARGHLQKAIELQPDLAEARVNLGVLEWESGQTEAAISQFRRASELDPANRDLVANLGLIYQQAGWAAQGVGVLQDYLRQHPTDVEILVQLAEALASQGDDTGALHAARQALSLDPTCDRARAVLTRLGGAGPDSGLGEDEAAP
ncbi:MAG: glycosyltransferase [Gemmatimonadota bacterium]